MGNGLILRDLADSLVDEEEDDQHSCYDPCGNEAAPEESGSPVTGFAFAGWAGHWSRSLSIGLRP